MPLVAIAVAVFAAGLLVGFGGLLLVAGAVVAVGAVAAVMRRDARIGLVVAAGALGIAHAAISVRADEHCRESVLRRGSFVATLASDATPRSHATAQIDDGCIVRMALDVVDGSANEGATVLVRGRPFRQGARMLVRDVRLTELRAPGWASRTRAAVGARIDALFDGDAPLARALVLADQRALDRDTRARYADAGIVHLLSVSGLHVAVIAAAVELLLLAMRLSRRAALLTSLALTILYVAAIGAPPPAVRSVAMFAVATTVRLLQRPTSPWAALSLGALAPLLLDARAILDLGYELSVLGMASLVASGSYAKRRLAGVFGRRGRALATALLVSFIATVASLPLIVWTFGRVSLIAPFANLLAGPLFGLLQPMLFLALALSFAPALATHAAAAAHGVIWASDVVARVASSIPFAAVGVSPTLAETACLATIAIALLVACASERPRRRLLPGGAAMLGLAVAPLVPSHGGPLELHVLDVGQGDALALRTPKGRWVLFDAGRAWRGGDAGRETVVPYVRARGGDVWALVLSHPHADHVGGAATVVRALAPRLIVDGGYVGAFQPYRALLEAAAADRRVRWHRAHPGDSLVVDGVVLELLAPDSTWASSSDDPNAASTIVRVRYGSTRMLLVGDAEQHEEAWLLAHEREQLAAEVLKVGHHGSRASSTDAFLDAVHPTLALVSVGAGNTYGHPSPEALARLAARGAYVLRTDQVGAIVVRTNGTRVEVEAEGGRWEPMHRAEGR